MLKGVEIKSESVVTFIKSMIETDSFLFHITSESTSKIIEETGEVLPLTVDGTRNPMLVKLGQKEKGTSSFTTDPIQIYLEDHGENFDNKNIVMIFDRKELQKQGVAPAKYVDEKTLRDNYQDYMYAPEEASFENEWRSLNTVNIKHSLRFICKVPNRVYVPSKNTFYFKE